jgi:cysteine sulfinate desulfinase/cysteine desulfurase-like protein
VIYLDYNATTPLCEAARTAMLPFLEGKFGNPSSVHAAGREARAAIDDARDRLADLLGAKPHELIFTSGGTEANNLAILGLARSRAGHGRHLISAKTEHHAVLNTIEHLEKREGFEVTWLNVSQAGRIDLDHLTDAIRDDTVLVSIMHANNETGVIQPLREISEICRERGVLLHSDMVQSFGKIPVDDTSPNKPAIPSTVEGSRGSYLEGFAAGSLDSARDDGPCIGNVGRAFATATNAIPIAIRKKEKNCPRVKTPMSGASGSRKYSQMMRKIA